jgi:hypothetical protein
VGHYCRDFQPDILAVTYTALPYVKAELASGPVEALLDSGALYSLMSGTVYRNLLRARQYVVTSHSQANCISATGHSFSVECVDSCKVRIERYTWKFRFLVVEVLLYPLLRGADVLRRTGLLFDIHRVSAFFSFNPCNKLPLIGRDFRPTATEVCAVTDSVPDMSHLACTDAGCISAVVEDFPDVLTPKLRFPHLLEYDIQLADLVIRSGHY